jgi:hypothetical protein
METVMTELKNETSEQSKELPDIDLDEKVNASEIGVARIVAQEVNVKDSAAGYVSAGEADLEDSFIGMVQARQTNIQKCITVAISAKDVTMKDSQAVVVVARDVVAKEIKPFILLAGKVDGPVQTTLDTPRALLAGLAAGLGVGIVFWFQKMLRGHK